MKTLEPEYRIGYLENALYEARKEYDDAINELAQFHLKYPELKRLQQKIKSQRNAVEHYTSLWCKSKDQSKLNNS